MNADRLIDLRDKLAEMHKAVVRICCAGVSGDKGRIAVAQSAYFDKYQSVLKATHEVKNDPTSTV